MALLSSVTPVLRGETVSDSFPELDILSEAYPDVFFEGEYDRTLEDWRVGITSGGGYTELIRAEGRFIPENLLGNRDSYRMLIYPFPLKLMDPETLSDEMLERVTRFGDTDNRRRAPVSNTAFFDAIYDSRSREDVESHIVNTSFLGLSVRVHERILGPLNGAERKIRLAARSDERVEAFIDSLGSAGGYSWRQISDTQGKSFHSMGLAVDLQPKDLEGRSIYWLWEKNRGNDRWMLLPLTDRWMPPEAVIDIFEEEGFIWGGKWPIWDNMHFEYRPELIVARDRPLGR